MNYNSWIFWGLFALVMLPYWRLSHRHQNSVLLAASYVFYGFWDYRFLFLILLSTAIDFIGGLAIAGEKPTPRQARWLPVLLVGSSLLLSTGIDYGALWAALMGTGSIADALPGEITDLWAPAATIVAIRMATVNHVTVLTRRPNTRQALRPAAAAQKVG